MTAPIPGNEEARLDKLRSLQILDTLSEGEFEDLVESASALLGVPISAVSFVDQDRQWFKAKVGVEVCETSREVAFCAHAILQSEPLVIPDATLDPRFCDNPMVTGPMGLRFYAGAPIVVDGLPIGTLCCKDSEPRTPSKRQINALSALARQASALLVARNRTKKLQESDDRFMAFFNHAPGVVFLKDEERRMRFVNRHFETMFGREASDVLGKTDHEWLPKDFADDCQRDDEFIMSTGESKVFEERVPVGDGEYRTWKTFKFVMPVGEQRWLGGVVVDVTDLRAAESKVHEQNEELLRREELLSKALDAAESAQETARLSAIRFEQLFAGLPVACYTYDATGTIYEWNAASESLWNLPQHHVFLKSIYETIVCERNREAKQEIARRVFAGESILGEEWMEEIPDRGPRWILTNTFPLRNAHGTIVAAVSANVDVTERKIAESALREKEERFRTVVESLHEGLVVYNSTGEITFWNRSAERVLGLSGNEMNGESMLAAGWQIVREDGSEFPTREHPIEQALITGEIQDTAIMGVQRPGSDRRWLTVNAAPVIPDHGGSPSAIVASFLDVTERLLQEQRISEQMDQIRMYSAELLSQKRELEGANTQLEALATTDGLTGLKNHRHFQDQLRKQIERCQASDRPLSIAFLDVDHFKQFNDEFGHQAGDTVLKEAANILQSNLLKGQLAARYGGEEFVLVMPAMDENEAFEQAECLRKTIAGHGFPCRSVTVSVGIATLDNALSDAASLIRAADEALYRSKSQGRNRVTPWSSIHAPSRSQKAS